MHDMPVAGEIRMAGGAKRTRPKVLSHMRVTPAENGGCTVEHLFDHGGPGFGYHEPETYAFGPDQGQEALSHIAKNLKIEKAKKGGGGDGGNGGENYEGEEG